MISQPDISTTNAPAATPTANAPARHRGRPFSAAQAVLIREMACDPGRAVECPDCGAGLFLAIERGTRDVQWRIECTLCQRWLAIPRPQPAPRPAPAERRRGAEPHRTTRWHRERACAER